MLVPAVQAAREAARRVACAAHLRQIGLAVQGYLDAYQALPPSGWDRTAIDRRSPVLDHSMKARLLGFLDREPLFDAINFATPVDPYQGSAVYLCNVTACSTQLAAFLCPSDAQTGNLDVRQPRRRRFPRRVDQLPEQHGRDADLYEQGRERSGRISLNPSQFSRGALGIAAVTDGTSQTAMFSEYLKYAGIGQDPTSPANRVRSVFRISWTTETGTPMGDSLACQASTAIQGDYKGEYWAQHDPGRGGGYFHTNPPNAKSCNGGYFAYGWIGASSAHPGGVNVLLLDGSVRFVRDGIDYPAWLALGTIAGGEVVVNDPY